LHAKLNLTANRLDPELAEPLASGVESGSHSPNWNVHIFGNFFVAQLLHLTKDQGRSKISGKLVEQLFDYNLVFDVPALMRLSAIELDEFGSFQSQPVHAETHADPIDEPGKGPIIAKLPDFSECLEERLLSDVLCLVTVTE
jgi:hypothetical protein